MNQDSRMGYKHLQLSLAINGLNCSIMQKKKLGKLRSSSSFKSTKDFLMN